MFDDHSGPLVAVYSSTRAPNSEKLHPVLWLLLPAMQLCDQEYDGTGNLAVRPPGTVPVNWLSFNASTLQGREGGAKQHRMLIIELLACFGVMVRKHTYESLVRLFSALGTVPVSALFASERAVSESKPESQTGTVPISSHEDRSNTLSRVKPDRTAGTAV